MTSAPIGHNGGPGLEDAAPAMPRGTCATCVHWTPPPQSQAEAYERFRVGTSKVRVARPTGTCPRVRLSRTGGTAFAATPAHVCCWNFEAKPAPPAPSGRARGYVTVWKGGRAIWQGNEEDLPKRFRDPEPAAPVVSADVDQLVDATPAPIGHNRPPPRPKPTPAQLRADLVRMLAARQLVAAEIAAIGGSIEHQAKTSAEAGAIAEVGGRTYCHGRHSTSWRPTHERVYQRLLEETLADLRERRRRELERLAGKLERQTAAVLAFARKHQLRVDLPAGRVVQPPIATPRPALKRYVLRSQRHPERPAP